MGRQRTRKVLDQSSDHDELTDDISHMQQKWNSKKLIGHRRSSTKRIWLPRILFCSRHSCSQARVCQPYRADGILIKKNSASIQNKPGRHQKMG